MCVALVVQVPWGRGSAKGLVLPAVQFNANYLTVVVAVLGTTISPYLFFWQAEEEVEETKEKAGRRPADPGAGRKRKTEEFRTATA